MQYNMTYPALYPEWGEDFFKNISESITVGESQGHKERRDTFGRAYRMNPWGELSKESIIEVGL